VKKFLTISSSSGGPEELSFPDAGDEALSTWLERHGHPLNTRCGGKGICRGCMVDLETPGGLETVRSCQTTLRNLPPGLRAIHIPDRSLSDATLHGVSTFEIAVDRMPPPREGIGLALDIGTTTVAGALWDYTSGRCLADGAVANAQRRHGDNVLARISFSIDHPDGPALLHKALIGGTLNPLVESLSTKAGIQPGDVTEANAAGNPIMLHTLANQPLDGFAKYPFRPSFLGRRRMAASSHGLAVPCALDLLPGLAPFVGSDIVAGAVASGMTSAEPPVLLIDFGTNGEILLKHASGFLATATAAGPAFEGGRLACGTAAAPGVISSLHRDNGAWGWELVGGPPDKRPTGISGAAFIDFIALGYSEGWINASGRFDRSHPGVMVAGDASPGASVRVGITDGIFVSEADVAEILQAKAAIAGGVSTLLELAGLEPGGLHSVLVAGGFGYHLNPGHAQAIGLLPDLPPERILLIGNSSLGGASLLLHDTHAADMDILLAAANAVELNQTPTFEDHFTDALMLP